MKSSETLWSTRGGGRGGRGVCLAVVRGQSSGDGEPGCAVAEKHQTDEPGGIEL